MPSSGPPATRSYSNSMSCAPSFSARARKCGYGWLYAGRLAGWWPSPWATVAEQPANVYGKRSPKATKGQQLATVTFLGGLPRGGDLLTMSATHGWSQADGKSAGSNTLLWP